MQSLNLLFGFLIYLNRSHISRRPCYFRFLMYKKLSPGSYVYNAEMIYALIQRYIQQRDEVVLSALGMGTVSLKLIFSFISL